MEGNLKPTYPWRESAILLAAAVIGYAIKLPFGLLATQTFGAPGARAGFSLWGYELMVLQLAAVIAGLLVFHRTGLPNAPWLERRLYGEESHKPRTIWRPALAGVFICLLVTIVVSLAATRLGVTSKLGSQLHSPSLPRSVLIELAALYPLAAIGAAFSEESVYRLGLISVLVWVVLKLTPQTNPRGLFNFWLPIIVSGLLFGYVHVAENLETAQLAGPIVSTLIAPQTWAGVVFGYLFCVYGLESAVICHVTADLTAPLVLAGLNQMLKLVH